MTTTNIQVGDVVRLIFERMFPQFYPRFTLRKGSYGLVIDAEHKLNSSFYLVEFDITPMFSITLQVHSDYLERVGTKSEVLDSLDFDGYKGYLKDGEIVK